MPKIEVSEQMLTRLVGERIARERMEELFTVAKAELGGRDGDTLKVELNDTNRPDLWSTAGFARQLRVYLSGKIPAYDFFSTPAKARPTEGRRVIVDAGLHDIRPYIGAFAVAGRALDDASLRDIIQSQEKLCWNFGRKRASIAMGVYRSDRIVYPVRYAAADPDSTRFVPLGLERELSLREILREHPKGQEFGKIVAKHPRFPFLTDDRGVVLSFPPVINSADVGAVQVGDSNLFIELTGTDLDSLLLATSIVACDLSDLGFTILPVEVLYPYDTPRGRSIVTPFYFQEPASVEVPYAAKLLGIPLEPEEAAADIRRMGCPARAAGDRVTIIVPEYRNDFLHPVDLVEDIMIARGLPSFEPEPPNDFTVGRLSEIEGLARRAKDIMIGLGYQEMIFNYLGSKRDFVDRMMIDAERMVRIANPMTENYEYVRSSILPALLDSEAASAHATFPHQLFELGKVAYLDEIDATGTTTRDHLGLLVADKEAGYNTASAHVSVLFYYLGYDWTVEAESDPRFLTGRCAAIVVGGKRIGVMGEIAPAVLENWGVQMPCAAAEIDVGALLEPAARRAASGA